MRGGHDVRLPNLAERLGTTGKVAHWFLATLSACAIAVLWLGYATVVRLNQAARSEGAADRDSAVAQSLSPETAAADGQSGAQTLGGPSAFQAFVEDQATKRNCSVSEFYVSPVPQPYVPSGSKGDAAGGWRQVQVSFSVVGRLTDVYDATASVSGQSVAFEPTSIEFDRQSLSDAGVATVVARVQGRVVERGGGLR